MTQKQIYDLLVDVFHNFDVKLIDKSTWSKIRIDGCLEVYTYSGYPDREDNIWYFNTYYDGHSKEIMIPKKDTSHFIQVYKDIYLDIVKAKEILKSVDDRLSSIGAIENIRDKKIDNIIDYDSQN